MLDRNWTPSLTAALHPAQLGKAISDHVREHIGLSTFNFVPILERPTTFDDMVTWSTVRPLGPETFTEAIQIADDEFGDMDVLSRKYPGPLDNYIHLGPLSELRRTRTYNEVWRPLHSERQVALFLRAAGVGPLGLVCIGRRDSERPFTEEDRRLLETLRAPTNRSLLAIRALEPGESGDILALLAQGLEMACFVFDATGRMLWLSDEALLRLETEAARWGSSYVFTRTSTLLVQLRELARSAARDPDAALR